MRPRGKWRWNKKSNQRRWSQIIHMWAPNFRLSQVLILIRELSLCIKIVWVSTGLVKTYTITYNTLRLWTRLILYYRCYYDGHCVDVNLRVKHVFHISKYLYEEKINEIKNWKTKQMFKTYPGIFSPIFQQPEAIRSYFQIK